MSRTQIILSWIFLALFWVVLLFIVYKQEVHAGVVMGDMYDETQIDASWNGTNLVVDTAFKTAHCLGESNPAGDCVDPNNGTASFGTYHWRTGIFAAEKWLGTYPATTTLQGTGNWEGDSWAEFETGFEATFSSDAAIDTFFGASADGDYFFIFDRSLWPGAHTTPNPTEYMYMQFTRTGGVWSMDGILDPPSTDFNEVVEYIYDPDLDNSFGTSTVGATFSIAQFEWIDSFGYTLSNPIGTIVATGTLESTENGTFTLSGEYDFDTTGVYILQAYFIQDGSTINNPVSLYISINAPTWSFDPVTGDLVPTASTTIATSSLTYLKVECPDDLLVGSLCKLAVGMFIPSTAAIQNVQASFYSLMNKAPFSFFTQSKTILDAFRIGTASSGGTFSLTLYGSSVPIVSSTTASNIGLGSSTIDFFKSIMTVGLWLMLAWYLYWRIASIFGV